LDVEAALSVELGVGEIDLYYSYSEDGLVVTEGWDVDGDGKVDQQSVNQNRDLHL
jgi:hypothetical protein